MLNLSWYKINFKDLDKDLKTKRLCLKISRKYRWEYEEAVWYRDEYKLLLKKKEKEKKEKKTRVKWNLKSFFDSNFICLKKLLCLIFIYLKLIS